MSNKCGRPKGSKVVAGRLIMPDTPVESETVDEPVESETVDELGLGYEIPGTEGKGPDEVRIKQSPSSYVTLNVKGNTIVKPIYGRRSENKSPTAK